MHWAVMVQTAVGVVLAVAAGAKLWGNGSAASFLEAMSVPPAIAVPVGLALPVAAGALGLLLVLRIGGGAVVLSAAALCTGLAVTLIVAVARGVTAGCPCFGVHDRERLTPVAVARVAILAVATLVLAARALTAQGGAPAPDGREFTVSLWLGLLAAVGYVAVFALLAALGRTGRSGTTVAHRGQLGTR